MHVTSGSQDDPDDDGRHDHLPAVVDADAPWVDEAHEGDRDERDPGQSKQCSTDPGLHGARRYPTAVRAR